MWTRVFIFQLKAKANHLKLSFEIHEKWLMNKFYFDGYRNKHIEQKENYKAKQSECLMFYVNNVLSLLLPIIRIQHIWFFSFSPKVKLNDISFVNVENIRQCHRQKEITDNKWFYQVNNTNNRCSFFKLEHMPFLMITIFIWNNNKKSVMLKVKR